MKGFASKVVAAACVLFTGCAHQHGLIMPLPDGQWFVRSECATWGVLFKIKGLTKVNERRSSTGEQVYAHFSANHINLSMWMEPVNNYCGGSVECAIQDMRERKRDIKASDLIRTYDTSTYKVIEYFLRTWPDGMPPVAGLTQGQPIDQLNVTALRFHDGYWADIHISVMGVKEEGLATVRQSFATLLEHLIVVPQQSVCRGQQ